MQLRSLAVVLVAAYFVALGNNALSQQRSNQPPVLNPPARGEVHDPRPDQIAKFARQYAQSGRPRMVLYWSVEFDDQIAEQTKRVTATRSMEGEKSSGFKRSTNGPAGDATLNEAARSKQTESVTETREVALNSVQREMPLAATDQALLRSAFVQTMGSAGLMLVDRSAAIRATAVSAANKNAKNVEARALGERADLILEILPVKDQSALSGVAFSVTLTDIRTSAELMRTYEQAHPWFPPAQSGWLATDRGFERRSSPPPGISASDIGNALALQVMNAVGPALLRARSK